MDALTREKIESSLLYSAFAAYLLRSTSYSKAAAGAYLLATTLFLRPRPEQPDFLKNGIYSLCSLVDGYLFWKVTDQLGQIKGVADLVRNKWMVGGVGWALVRTWSVLKEDEIRRKKETLSPTSPVATSAKPVPNGLFQKFNSAVDDDVRKSIDNNLFYSALFALSLTSSQPKLYSALLAFGTTCLFRPDARTHAKGQGGQGRIVAHAGFTLTHLIDGYLFCKVAALSQGNFKQLLTNPWTIGASLWSAGRLFTIVSPQFSKKLNKDSPLKNSLKMPSAMLQPSRILDWTVFDPKRCENHLRLKYVPLFLLATQPSYLNRYSVALTAATALLLPPNALGTITCLIDSVLFWQAVVPLSTVRQFSQLSPSLWLWGAGCAIWTAASLVA